jgi:formate dehydrogenase subunit delta
MTPTQHSDTTRHLEKMANDIGDFFAAEPDREDAIKGISNHIRSYWTPRMREAMFAEVARGGAGLHELPRAALLRLMRAPSGKPQQPPGGDAG